MASKNAKNFTLDLKKFGKLSKKKAVTLFKKIAIDLDSRIVYATPVDTGIARGGWVPSLNLPSNVVNDSLFDMSGDVAVGRLIAVVSGAKLGDIVWLSNSVDYINLLEDGSSTQAPLGMVSANVAAVVSFYGGDVAL